MKELCWECDGLALGLLGHLDSRKVVLIVKCVDVTTMWSWEEAEDDLSPSRFLEFLKVLEIF